MPEIIKAKIISRPHDDLWVGYFGIEKTSKLMV